jgi:uncharacterized repeat protein (TIGR03806 family)
VLWENRRLLGSPDPPSPYTVERTFSKIDWKAPLYVAPEPGTNWIWAVLQGTEKQGASRIVRIDDDPNAEQTETIFQLEDRLIYGLTFHPDFISNRFVFLFINGPTSANERTNRVVRYKVRQEAPFPIDAASEQVILEWRSMGHDGGDLAFGLDGMLYIASGDGTTDSDTWNSGQDVSNLLATLIRIDVDHPAADKPYSVPQDNPFVTMAGARPEIWAYGFRNPWRMCIDAKTGDVWVGNNGQDLWETAYLVRRGDNFGWSVYEGNHPFYLNRKRGPTPIMPPTIEHHHSEFRSLTGGVVYYGDRFPELNGAYIYGDYSTGKIWGARHENGRLVWHEELADTSLQIAAFRVDQRGDLLIVDHGGGIYRLIRRPLEHAPLPFPTRLSETGLFESMGDYRVHAGVVAYSVVAPGWADGAEAERHIAVPGDSKIKFRASRGWDFPDGTALVQTLSINTRSVEAISTRRVETRLLLKQQGEWAGYTYRWNVAQTDAELVGKVGEDIEIEVRDAAGLSRQQRWRVPSRAECMTCHSRAANFLLGLTQLQMNRDQEYWGQTCNQLEALNQLGLLSEWPPKPAAGPSEVQDRLVNPYDEAAGLDERARAYLHTNCSVCHVEAGGGNAKMELEFTVQRDKLGLFGSRPQHDTFGVTDAMLVAPGEPSRSILLERLSRRGRGQMPPLVTAEVDHKAVQLMRDWISQMKAVNTFVRAWTMDDLVPHLDSVGANRSFTQGKLAFDKVGCAQCHRFFGEGGTVGPDLTGIGRRQTKREILESIIEPSKVVTDEYASYLFATEGGKVVTGRIEHDDGEKVTIRTGSGADDVIRLAKSDIVERRKSNVSNMPAGTVHVLEREQILDLMAYLLSDGDSDKPAFK